jgi:two-component system chemotaxis response regulator CheB
MPNADIIVIGASAGGVETLTQLVSQLSSPFPAAIFIAIHFPSYGVSLLPSILSRAGSLPALHPVDGETIHPGNIYIAPPDHHLLVRQGHIQLSRGPRENGHRPAIDPLFRSAALSYGSRVIGIIMSGALDDGVAGLATVKACGGIAIAQDPSEALFNSMPCHAIETVKVDRVLRIHEIAAYLNQLNPKSTPEDPAMADEIKTEADLVAQDKTAREQGEYPGSPFPVTCPDCGGVLWELHHNNLLRFRCHVGHVYSLDSLVAEQSDDVEQALWSSIRALEEKAALARRLAVQAKQSNRAMSAARFLERAEEAHRHANLIRRIAAGQPALREPSSDSLALHEEDDLRSQE